MVPSRPVHRPPLDYLAFRELHHGLYLRYAAARTGDAEAAACVVEAVFSALAAGWAEVLRSARPAATAWEVLVGRIASCAGGGEVRETDALRADAVLLHRGLGLPVTKAAEVMGIDAPSMHVLLRP